MTDPAFKPSLFRLLRDAAARLGHLSSRFASRLLAMVFVTAAMAGCGGDSTDVTTPPTPTAISVQPASGSAVTGSSVTFSVTATGDSLTFQWQSSHDSGASWTELAGASASSYTIAAVDSSMNGWQYRVKVTGAGGAVISAAVTLTAVAQAMPPVITSQPAAQAVAAGAGARFSVTASGTSLAYQWQVNPDGSAWTAVAGATGATLTLNGVAITDSGHSYRVIVSNSAGSVTSLTALLTVTVPTAAPAIGTQPLPASVIAPQTATFSVSATGTPAPGYQWQVSSDGGVTFNNVAAATAASYTTPATVAADNGKVFRVTVSSSAGSVLSSPATLTVTALSVAPTIVTQPVGQVVNPPNPATFAVSATGSPSPVLQWQASADGGSTFANINGANAATYTTPATTPADSGKQYRVVAMNSAGSVASAAAVLTISATSPVSSNHFVYAVNGNSATNAISGFAVNAATGSLSPTPGSPYATIPNAKQISIHPNGRFAYVTSPGSGGIAGYSIDQASGALTAIPGAVTGDATGAAIFHPTGRFAYFVGNSGAVFGYSVDSSTGALRAVAGSPFSVNSASSFQILPSGRFAFATTIYGTSLTTIAIDPSTGALSVGQPLSIALPQGIVVHPGGQFIYGLSATQSLTQGIQYYVAGYVVNGNDGSLTPLPSYPISASQLTRQLIMNPNGKVLYLNNVGNNNATSLYTLHIDPATGRLSDVAGSPLVSSGGGHVLYLTLAPSGTFGYLSADSDFVADSFSNSISIDAATGIPSLVANGNLPTSSSGGYVQLLISPLDNALYATSYGFVAAFSLDAGTHVPTLMTGGQFITDHAGVPPTSIVFK